jgi:RHH-type proline utilization regulon transcriptional repressor/proline dehydrogenase/delta 1-pyrroline-5-carboxylate dehydrogenase
MPIVPPFENEKNISSTLDNFYDLYRADETQLVAFLLNHPPLSQEQIKKAQNHARGIIEEIRSVFANRAPFIDAFMQTYDLSSPEGLLLMALAEALPRIPDAKTKQDLLKDKLSQADFKKHLKARDFSALNLSTQGLSFLSSLLKENKDEKNQWKETIKNIITVSSKPFFTSAVSQTIKFLANKFVMSETIEGGLKKAKKDDHFSYSFDMLGEAALTAKDVDRYYQAYLKAIHVLKSDGDIHPSNPGISIKLSALHPRYEYAQKERVENELWERLYNLTTEALKANVMVTIDAEESDRLALSLSLFERLAKHTDFKSWNGLGLAVQSYQKGALAVLAFLEDVALSTGHRLNVRLVKGAYWDSEIKWSQEKGLKDYPVFTRKTSTDIHYLLCAEKLLKSSRSFYPQFATHNALTASFILEMAKNNTDFEFQRLHGMGEVLYKILLSSSDLDLKCRVYAPIGPYKELLPYLVRRLLENGANSSFINHLSQPEISLETLLENPFEKASSFSSLRHPQIPLPQNLYGSERQNSKGFDLANPKDLDLLLKTIKQQKTWACSPIINGETKNGKPHPMHNPADHQHRVGNVIYATQSHIEDAFDSAEKTWRSWEKTSPAKRAELLLKVADLFEKNFFELLALSVKEAGKTLPDSIAEVREAIDFCRYYAFQGEKDFLNPKILPGPTGEENKLFFRGRGIFVCISPWNFPLAIFAGQIAAALMAGNAVIAKPAEQTPLMAFKAVQLFLEAGIPPGILHLIPGDSKTGAALVKDPRVAGVAFTGSLEAAWSINQSLASKQGPLIPLIAETGGQNAMIVDSSALAEQVVKDVLASAFQSAGQRCSALRLLLIQEDIFENITDMLKGAMAELKVGDPSLLSTDVGPLIDKEAQQKIKTHKNIMKKSARLLYECVLDKEETALGNFEAPCAFELDSLKSLTHEVFGPVLHVMRFKAKQLHQWIEKINSLNFGLTGGLHTRLEDRITALPQELQIGNVYINRNLIGAVVGVQPFGGQGLSGTGPKAGGPYYLHRFATEQTVSINRTAQGGNIGLLNLDNSQ